MPIYTIAQYQIRPSGVDKVKQAIEEFVRYVQAQEPRTRMYTACQQKDDPTRFTHFFIFEDEAAHTAHSKSEAVKRFEAAYRRLYSRSIPGVDIEILSWVVSLRAPAEGRLAAETVERPGDAAPKSHRAVFDPDRGEFVDTPIYWRADLAPGAQIRGPAVIAEDETSTIVSADFDVRIDRFGYIELTRRES